jgi:hypothetical protein
VGKEVSGDMKANSAQGRRQHGQNKVIFPGKVLSCSGVAIAHSSPQTIEIMGCFCKFDMTMKFKYLWSWPCTEGGPACRDGGYFAKPSIKGSPNPYPSLSKFKMFITNQPAIRRLDT